jgi:hypothetical protein
MINDFLRGRMGNGCKIIKSTFERYNLLDSNGAFHSIHSHQFRHWVTTKAAQAGVPDHIIARWQGREHIEDLGAYKHLTPAERLQTLKAALKDGRMKGQVAEMYFNLKEDVRDIFLEGQLQAVHVTPLGLCVHYFKVTPCPKFLNCVKDCEDYMLDTANKGHINNLVQLQTRTELILDQARQQRAKGEEDLSENWIAETEATLSGVQRILDAASITASGTVQPFKGERSKFERFGHRYCPFDCRPAQQRSTQSRRMGSGPGRRPYYGSVGPGRDRQEEWGRDHSSCLGPGRRNKRNQSAVSNLQARASTAADQ